MFDPTSSLNVPGETDGAADAELEREAAAQALSVEQLRARQLLERQHKLQAIRSFLAAGEGGTEGGGAPTN